MIVASTNEGKLKELKFIFVNHNLISLQEAGVLGDVEEDRDTIFGNALKKAKEICALTNQATLSDDSGLCIDEYDGWPGVKTARFLGEKVPPRVRNEFILEKMKGLPKEKRKAKVVCVLVCAFPNGEYEFGEGVVNGYISTSLKGDNGFGFDEIFELENGQTLAQMPKEEKNKMSARYLAAIELNEKLSKYKSL